MGIATNRNQIVNRGILSTFWTTKLVQYVSRAWRGLLAKAHPVLDPLLKDVCCTVNVEMVEVSGRS